MCLDHRRLNDGPPSLQQGFSIITAIFLLVVMAALGAYMLTFSSVQQTNAAQDLQGSRAYQAARAGVEFGIYQVTRKGVCGASNSLTLSGTLSAFAVTVNCNSYTFTEGGRVVAVYQIKSTAVQAGGAVGSTNSIERQLVATLSL
jgi:MSHA biogenesis protein MshP